MDQPQLKNIYEALGSMYFKYHGKMHFVDYLEDSDFYILYAVQ